MRQVRVYKVDIFSMILIPATNIDDDVCLLVQHVVEAAKLGRLADEDEARRLIDGGKNWADFGTRENSANKKRRRGRARTLCSRQI